MGEPYDNWPAIMTVDDIRRCLGVSRNDAYQMVKAANFPLLIAGKQRHRRVLKQKLIEYIGGANK